MSMEPSNLFTFEEKVRLSKAETERIRRTPGPAGHPICGIVVGSSWHEPVACAYPPGHDGDHSWASIPALAPLCAREESPVIARKAADHANTVSVFAEPLAPAEQGLGADPVYEQLSHALDQACTNLAVLRPDLSREDTTLGFQTRLWRDALLSGWGGPLGFDPGRKPDA